MKNHREMFEALLEGKIVITEDGSTSRMLNTEGFLETRFSDSVSDIPKVLLDNWNIFTKTISINGFEVPEPVRIAVEGNFYYIVDFSRLENYSSIKYDKNYQSHLQEGLIHWTAEAVKLHTKALLSFTNIENKKEES